MIASGKVIPVPEFLAVLLKCLFVLLLNLKIDLVLVKVIRVNLVLFQFLMVTDLSLVEGSHSQRVQPLLLEVFFVFTLFIEGVLQGEHVPHAYLCRLHMGGVSFLDSRFKVNVCGLEISQRLIAGLVGHKRCYRFFGA